jgi:hypothetical protein
VREKEKGSRGIALLRSRLDLCLMPKTQITPDGRLDDGDDEKSPDQLLYCKRPLNGKNQVMAKKKICHPNSDKKAKFIPACSKTAKV